MKKSDTRILSLLGLACVLGLANHTAAAQTLSGASGASANAVTGYATIAALSPVQGIVSPLHSFQMVGLTPSLSGITAISPRQLALSTPGNTSLPRRILNTPNSRISHAPDRVVTPLQTTRKGLAGTDHPRLSGLATLDLMGARKAVETGPASLSNSYQTASRAAASHAAKRRSAKSKRHPAGHPSKRSSSSATNASSSGDSNRTIIDPDGLNSDLDELGNPSRRQSDGPDSVSDEPTRGQSSTQDEFGNDSSGGDVLF